MEWGGIEQQSARAVLRALAHLLNDYKRTMGPGVDGANPITAVLSIDINLAFAVDEDSEEWGPPVVDTGPTRACIGGVVSQGDPVRLGAW
jgi:hypothetical protein